MDKLFFAKIQAEQVEWSVRNFGAQPAHRPLLGIIEELCELDDALILADTAAIIDAVGDVGIYMLDYCGKRGWSMQEVWDERIQLTPDWRLTKLIGSLAHHQLKGEQNIRGGSASHDELLRTTLGQVLSALELLSERHYTAGVTFPIILSLVWYKVKQRNWVANPNDAHTVAEGLNVTEEIVLGTVNEEAARALNDVRAVGSKGSTT